jgi:hypothetical protein
MNTWQKMLFGGTALAVVLFAVIVIDAAAHGPSSCELCVEPAPHAWEDVRRTP